MLRPALPFGRTTSLPVPAHLPCRVPLPGQNSLALRVLTCVLLVIGSCMAPGHLEPASAAGKMYWLDGNTGRIQRANLDGTGIETLVSLSPTQFRPAALALDVAAGKMYWTSFMARKIQRANLDGTGVQDVVTVGSHAQLIGIALDIVNGRMYWVEVFGGDGSKVGIRRARLDGSGVEDVINGQSAPWALALDLDGNRMYWSDYGFDTIRRATLNGTGVQVVVGAVESFGIALDVAAGKMYWTDLFIKRANLDGSAGEILYRPPAGVPSSLMAIALDVAAGKMYWADAGAKKIMRANLDGTGIEDVVTTGLERPLSIALDLGAPPPSVGVAAAILPASRAVQVNHMATAFATMLAVGTGTATSCSISPTNAPPGTTFFYQQTNASNVPIGQPNTPATIAAGASQTFVLGLTPGQPFGSTDIHFSFACTNTLPAPDIAGVNTLLLTSSNSATPDMVALVAAPGGILSIPGPTGTSAFAVATINVGASGQITVTADTGSASVPLVLSLCQTDPVTGGCVNPASPAPSVAVRVDPSNTPTFAVFARATGSVPFSPGVNRVFVRFRATGTTVGATSVAVTTQ
jgi:Low-density lipoprotein receptor repeat class B